MLDFRAGASAGSWVRNNAGQWLAGVLIAMALASSAYSDAVLQDPTRPLVYSPSPGAAPSALTLQAVFLRDTGHQAVVNGRLVRVGDEVEGVRIKSIHRNKIFLVSDGKVRELELRPSILSTSETEG